MSSIQRRTDEKEQNAVRGGGEGEGGKADSIISPIIRSCAFGEQSGDRRCPQREGGK